MGLYERLELFGSYMGKNNWNIIKGNTMKWIDLEWKWNKIKWNREIKWNNME